MNGKVIGVISIKGGVGKTTTVANLGAAFAEMGKKTLVVDANLSAPNLGLHLGVVNPKPTLHDVLANVVDVPKAIHPTNFGFDLLPSSLTPKKVNAFQLKRKMSYLKNHYDMIIIDSSPTLNYEMLATMIASDELLVVSSPDFPTLSCTLHAVKIAKDKGTPITGIILNKVHNKEFELNLDEIEDATKTPVLAMLPYDIKVLEALSETKPATLHAPLRDVSVGYRKLAACLIGEEYKDPRVWTKVKEFFLNDTAKDQMNRTMVQARAMK